MVLHTSRMAALPPIARRDIGPWRLGGKLTAHRRRYDEIIERLVADVRCDPGFEERNDALALMLQAR